MWILGVGFHQTTVLPMLAPPSTNIAFGCNRKYAICFLKQMNALTAVDLKRWAQFICLGGEYGYLFLVAEKCE